MTKVAACLVAGTLLVAGGVGSAGAEQWPTHFQQLYPYGDYGARRVSTPNGYRCRGMSYGTGAQSCGTATGGPAGGLSSGN